MLQTTEQKAREYRKLKEIEEIRAKERQAEYHGNQHESAPVENFPPVQNGKSRDIAASKIGMSGKTAEKAANKTLSSVNNPVSYPTKLYFIHIGAYFMNRIILILSILLLIPLAVMAADVNYGTVECKFIKNYDGDTLTVNIPSYPAIIGKNISIRVNGIDTPELRGTKGRVKELARAAKNLTRNICKRAGKTPKPCQSCFYSC